MLRMSSVERAEAWDLGQRQHLCSVQESGSPIITGSYDNQIMLLWIMNEITIVRFPHNTCTIIYRNSGNVI